MIVVAIIEKHNLILVLGGLAAFGLAIVVAMQVLDVVAPDGHGVTQRSAGAHLFAKSAADTRPRF
jgi:hypothetical protein